MHSISFSARHRNLRQVVRSAKQIATSRFMSRLPFEEVERSREAYNPDESFKMTKSPNPDWKAGLGANNTEWKKFKKLSIDPNGGDRTPIHNYKLLISSITPRPIGFLSTISAEGVKNLAPFSYFQVVNADPPIFTIGISQGQGLPKDSLRNILDTKELTLNIISEWFIEAANATSTNAPFEVDEWEISGLTPQESLKVKSPHVAESAFSVEAKLIHHHDWTSKSNPDKVTGTLLIVEGIHFHIREDVLDKDGLSLDISKLKPVARLGGITYGKVTSGFELPRPEFSVLKKDFEAS